MARYCTNCYTPASQEDVFCKVCGQPLKATVEKTENSCTEEVTAELMPAEEKAEESNAERHCQAEPVCTDTENKDTKAENAPVISLGEWVWSTLLCFIPIVGLIMLIIWAATAETNPNKKNFARAMLIWKGVEILLSIVFFTMIMAALVAFSGIGMGYMF